MTLAALYTLRIIAEVVALVIELSFWVLAFSMYLFTSLAFVTRFAELARMRDAGGADAKGRGYVVGDLPLNEVLGARSGYLGVLALALYINSSASHEHYSRPELLFLLCPALLYWSSRAWLTTDRGEGHQDPIVVAFTGRSSLLVGGAVVAIELAAI